MFAQRLLRSILPKWLTRKLEKLHPELLEPPIPPTSPEVPPTITVTPTPTIEPTPGVIAKPTPGVDAEPTPIAPEAITPPPVFGIGVDIPEPPTGGSIPPLYVRVFSGGPVYLGPKGLGRKPDDWFDEQFNDLTKNNWTILEVEEGTATIENGRLKLYAPGAPDFARVDRVETRSVPENFDFVISAQVTDGGTYLEFRVDNDIHSVNIWLENGEDVRIYVLTGWVTVQTSNFVDEYIVWKVQVRGDQGTLWRNNVKVCGPYTLATAATVPGRMWIRAGGGATVFVNYYEVQEK